MGIYRSQGGFFIYKAIMIPIVSVTLIFAKRDFYSPKYMGDYSSINTPPEIEDVTPKMDPT